jgi:hypothetical protein
MTSATTSSSRFRNLAAEAVRLPDKSLEFPKGDEAAAEGHRADDAADHGERSDHRRQRFAAVQFHGRDRGGGAAAHAVVERDHLRHVGHGHALAADPGEGSTHHDGPEDQGIVAHPRIQQGEDRRDQHAGAGPHDAAARGHRRAQAALQAHDEQERGDEVTRLDQQEPRASSPDTALINALPVASLRRWI